MKQITRKWLVSLKRRPQNIPLFMLIICCFIYTFNLTAHSNATMYVSSRIIALYVFIITLTSFLSIFSFINAYGKKKRKWIMRAIVYAMIGLQIALGTVYYQVMMHEVFERDDPVPMTPDISASMNGTLFHIIALSVTLLVIVCIPLYHKLLLKINTTIEDEEDISYDAETFDVGDL